MNITSRFTTFFKEVVLEIKKVNWPTREETIRYTTIVIGMSLVVALYLGLLDVIFNTVLNSVTNFLGQVI